MAERETLEKKIIGSLLLTTENFKDCEVLTPSHFTEFNRICMFRVLRDYAKMGIRLPYENGNDSLYLFLRAMRGTDNKTHPDVLEREMYEMVELAEDFRNLGSLAGELASLGIPQRG